MIVVGHEGDSGQPIVSDDETHALVIGPPRSGKTTGVLAPSILTHIGPIVVTSSKDDVIGLTARFRRDTGPIFLFTLEHGLRVPSAVRSVGWDPVAGCADWDEALLRARSLVGATRREGGSNGDGADRFWYNQAERLLAALLYGAALARYSAEDVARWVLTADFAEPGALLADAPDPWAAGVLSWLERSDPRICDSVLATAGDALRVYDSQRARELSALEPFPVEEFLDSGGTCYIVASSERQTFFAPLVVGLLDQIRRAAFARSSRTAPVLFALDELANIAPLPHLPGLLSEGGSQGVQVLACLQDLSQARQRWGVAADGFLTLFRHKVLLPGVLDRVTIETLAVALGPDPSGGPGQRPRWPAHDLARIPAGWALHVDGATPHHVRVVGVYEMLAGGLT